MNTPVRIKNVDPETAGGPDKEIIEHVRAEYGYVPGIVRLLLADHEVHTHVGALYRYLHLRPGSPLTRKQREMVATVVNGLVGGAA